ncbi:MAG: hypothetical protein WCC87_05735 [Candidatus Korobacteraceae bacterium]
MIVSCSLFVVDGIHDKKIAPRHLEAKYSTSQRQPRLLPPAKSRLRIKNKT